MTTTPGGGDTANLVNSSIPTVGGQGGKSKFIGVSDDYGRPTQIDEFDNPMRRVAPGTIVGGRPGMTTPLYNDAWFEAQLANMAPEDVWLYQQQMARAGFIKPKARVIRGIWDDTTRNAFKNVVELANVYTTDVDTALALAMQGGAGALAAGAGLDLGEDQPFTGTKKRTDKTVNLTNPQEARARLRSVLRDELGRPPREDEMAAFISALGASERSNPVVEQQVAHIVEDEVTGTDVTRSGGVDPAAFTDEYVRTTPQIRDERAAFMRDTDYYSAAMSVLGEGGGQL